MDNRRPGIDESGLSDLGARARGLGKVRAFDRQAYQDVRAAEDGAGPRMAHCRGCVRLAGPRLRGLKLPL